MTPLNLEPEDLQDLEEHEEGERAARRIRRRRAVLESWRPVGDIHTSPVAELLTLPQEDRWAALEALEETEALELLHDWRAWARPDQLPPQEWTWGWLILAGRGWGKSRTGAEAVKEAVETGTAERVALVGRTVADVRMVMVEGESGLLACYPPDRRPAYEPSKRTVTWLEPGERFVSGSGYAGHARRAIAFTYSDDQPDQLRGPQHDLAWGDEPAAWRNAWAPGGATPSGEHPQEGGTWSNLMLGLRLGNPRWVATTTPKPVKLIRYLTGPHAIGGVIVTRGSTYDNLENLAEQFAQEVLGRYKGTRLERQEILGELLEELEGAMWTWGMLERARAAWAQVLSFTLRPPATKRVVIAVDPPASADTSSAEAGIVACAQLRVPDRYAVLGDYSLPQASPAAWARRAIDAFHELGADRIVAERNNGGEMVLHTIKSVDSRVPVVLVWASRGKATRAEPVAAFYEQGKVLHAPGMDDLEAQLLLWTPDSKESPDRLDALVWGLSWLAFGARAGTMRAW